MNSRKLALLGLILALLGSFFVFDLGQYLNLEALKAQQAALNAQVASNPWQAAGLFFLAYVAVTAASLAVVPDDSAGAVAAAASVMGVLPIGRSLSVWVTGASFPQWENGNAADDALFPTICQLGQSNAKRLSRAKLPSRSKRRSMMHPPPSPSTATSVLQRVP